MARLVSPAGTVVEVEGDLAESLAREGWSVEVVEPPKRRPSRKSD